MATVAEETAAAATVKREIFLWGDFQNVTKLGQGGGGLQNGTDRWIDPRRRGCPTHATTVVFVVVVVVLGANRNIFDVVIF